MNAQHAKKKEWEVSTLEIPKRDNPDKMKDWKRVVEVTSSHFEVGKVGLWIEPEVIKTWNEVNKKGAGDAGLFSP